MKKLSLKFIVQDSNLRCDYNEREDTTETVNEFEENICDCQEMTFCFIIEQFQECNSTTINLDIKVNITLLSQFQCDVSPLEFQPEKSSFKLLQKTDNGITGKILTDSDSKKYKIVCEVLVFFNEFNITSSKEWEIVNHNPIEVTVHSELELELTIIKQTEISQLPLWCFLLTPDNNIEIMSTSWISDSKIHCSGFNPVIPGIFTVSLGSVMTPTTFDNGISIKVVSKHPVALKAEYSFNFDTIFIYFDENIEFHTTCANAFPKQHREYFGVGFNCSTKGNIFIVKMGAQFKLLDSLVISPDNDICLAGSQGTKFCLPALPLSLLISKPKISGPNLSLYVNSKCGGNSTQNNMYIKVLPSNCANLFNQNQTFQNKSSGKSQRKNLMIWRTMRQFQRKLSSRVTLQMNATDVLPFLENFSLLDNILNVDLQNIVSSIASVSVFVQSSLTTTFIVAEANVTFCEGSIKLFRYKWYINEKHIFEDGKIITVEDLSPGKYVVKCVIIAHNSSDVLGKGWTTTEVLASDETVLIVPSEITVGLADDIFLRAVTWRESSVSWTCRKNLDKLCFTIDKKLVSDVFELNSPNISIPGGTLPNGNYIWTVKNARRFNTAKVFIRPENVTAIDAEISSVLVRPSQVIILRGIVRKVKHNCLAWWSSVRQKGFSYFNLQRVERLEKKFPNEEVILKIPSENQKKLEPDAFYMFKFQVFCPSSLKNPKGSLDYIKIPVGVGNPPCVLPLIVEPLEGKALITNFVISGADAGISVEDNPLLFEWSYVDPCDEVIPIKRGAFSEKFTTYLPPGDLKLIVKVCNGKKVCNTMSSPTISVLQAFEFPAENFSYESLLRKARHRIQYLMSIGDTLEAFGVAITVFKSLVLIVEPGVREDIFLTVKEAIKIRINDLTMKMRFDSKAAKVSLNFFEQALKVAKYFRKNSDIMNLLLEFNNSISKIVNSKESANFDEN